MHDRTTKRMVQKSSQKCRYVGFASNMHLATLGSCKQEESIPFETAADEARDFAEKLKIIADNFDS